jgi:hypothetical protein
VTFLAYPFGHHDAAVRTDAEQVGHRAAFTFLNGRATAGVNPFALPRLTLWKGEGRAALARHVCRRAATWPDHQRDVISTGFDEL